MTDIRDHKWSDESRGVMGNSVSILSVDNDSILFSIDDDEHGHDRNYVEFKFNKDDSIAMIKHFYNGMTDKQQHDFFHTMNKGRGHEC